MIGLLPLKSNITSLIPHHSNKRFLFALVSVLLWCAYIFGINTPTSIPYSIKSLLLVAVLLFLMLYGFVYSYNTFKKIVLLSIALVSIGLSAQNPTIPFPASQKLLQSTQKIKDKVLKGETDEEIEKLLIEYKKIFLDAKKEMQETKKAGGNHRPLMTIMIKNNPNTIQKKIIGRKQDREIAELKEKNREEQEKQEKENEKQAQQETIIKKENEKQEKENEKQVQKNRITEIQDQVEKRYEKQKENGTTQNMIDELKKITEQPGFRQTEGISQKAFDDIRKIITQK